MKRWEGGIAASPSLRTFPPLRPLLYGHAGSEGSSWAPVLDTLKPTITKTSQELRMLSSVTINCQVTKIVMNSGSQLSEL